MDSGYYGNGYYFTTYPHYGAHYIKWRPVQQENGGFHYQAVGNTVKVTLSFLALGKSKEISDLSFQGKPCAPQHQSHYVRVTKKHFGSSSKLDFFPVSNEEKETADEIVVFETDQILPFFVVSYQRLK